MGTPCDCGLDAALGQGGGGLCCDRTQSDWERLEELRAAVVQLLEYAEEAADMVTGEWKVSPEDPAEELRDAIARVRALLPGPSAPGAV